jgi:hypothetical protein
MPFTLTIDPARRLAVVTGAGPCDVVGALAALRQVGADPAFGPDFRVLIDLRAAEYAVSDDEARALAAYSADPAGLGGCRIARVVRGPVEYGAGAAVAARAEFGGGRAATFLTVASALAWLDC